MATPRQPHQTAILIIGVLIVVAMIIGTALRPILRRGKANDLGGTRVQSGTAKIEALYGANPNEEDSRTKPWAMVRFEGKLLPAASAQHIERLKVGETARIMYRIGRSGKTYVDTVEPLP